MELKISFLAYAAFFRIAVIIAGIVAMYLGFRLFLLLGSVAGDTNAEDREGKFKLPLKSVAGTCFALFGAIMILTMVIQGPELAIAELEKVDASGITSGITEPRRQISMKSGQDSSVETKKKFKQLIKKAHAETDPAKAILAYKESLSISKLTLKDASEAFNGLAWIYFEQNRSAEALPLSRLAVQLDTENSAYLDTLANVLLKQGDHLNSLQYASKAVSNEPSNAEYLVTLANAYEANGQGEKALSTLEKAAGLDSRFQSELKRFRAKN